MMIEEDIFYKVRAILLKRNNSPTVYQKIRPEFPLRGFLLCPECGNPLRAGFSKGRSQYYGYYFCQLHSKPSLPVDDLDDACVDLLRKLTPSDLLRMMFLEDVKHKWNDSYMSLVKQQAQVHDKIETLKQLKHEIAKKNIAGVYDDAFTKEQLDKVDLEITAVKTIISESKLAQIDIEILVKFMDGFLEDLGKVYMQEKSIELKRFFIGSIFPKKLIFRNEKLEPLSLASSFEALEAAKNPSVSISARERTRTSKALRPIGPKPIASTDFATLALSA